MERVLAAGSWALNPGRWVDSLLSELEKLREAILPAEASFSRGAQERLGQFAD
jgi:hypothetical protein